VTTLLRHAAIAALLVLPGSDSSAQTTRAEEVGGRTTFGIGWRQNEGIAGEHARRILRDTMVFVNDEMDRVPDLTEAIEAVNAGASLPAPLPHAFEREFTLKRLTPEEAAAQFLTCGTDTRPATGAVYYATLFRFRRDDSAALGLLWAQEDGSWKLLSYRTFEV
jgi:hypothetical protein